MTRHSDIPDMTEVLNDHLKREAEGPWTRTTHVYHPSSLGMCQRSMYYDRIGAPIVPKYSERLSGYFLGGHAYHHALQSAYSQCIPDFQEEVRCTIPELGCSGSCDGFIPSTGLVLEIKTISKKSFMELTKPKPDHVKQVHCYMAALNTDVAQILYINRDDGRRRPAFQVRWDERIWREIRGQLLGLERRVACADPPPQEISMDCDSCKFLEHCKPPGRSWK